MHDSLTLRSPRTSGATRRRPLSVVAVGAAAMLSAALGFGVRAWTESTPSSNGSARTAVTSAPARAASSSNPTAHRGVTPRDRPGREPARGFGKPL